MLIFLYDTWNSDEVRGYFGITGENSHSGTLSGYSVGYTADGYASIYASEGNEVTGTVADISDITYSELKEWLEGYSFILEKHTLGIEEVAVFSVSSDLIIDDAVSLSSYELLGVLQYECPLSSDKSIEDVSNSDKEVDLFSKYTYRDKEWWNKYKIAMISLGGLSAAALVVFGVILVQWFWSSKHTDDLGVKVREEVTASTTVSSAPTAVKGFNGEPIEIILPEEIQPADDAFEVLEIDFDELRKKYPNAVAWLMIPGVGIEYPVAQYEDNEYYLTHGIDGTLSRAGWVFADYRNTFDIPMRNFIIYGHNMKDGTIFGKLPRVLDESWWSNPDNQYIYLVTEYYTAVFQVYTTLRVKSEEVYYYRRDLGDRNIVGFMEEMKGYDLIPDRLTYNKPFKSSDKIITLSTCADAQGVEKFVVQGVLVYSKQLKEGRAVVDYDNLDWEKPSN